ncbi:putative membrane protein [Rickettsia parkeri str. Tate's Hell]|uniref:Membrane protein n=1 Tax=Rickettsia parkeri str. Tate's Hell TaxID=1359189 RepID=A0ABR5DNL1_RICPA|nr:hypothetical protein MC1_00645 [Rickettsia parkeri str. Portsmouth]KJV95666.1 putative membrane protein [Rickettsia parkeri str. AT\
MAISLFIDTFIVIGIMSLFNIFPFNQLGHLVLNSYSFYFLLYLVLQYSMQEFG